MYNQQFIVLLGNSVSNVFELYMLVLRTEDTVAYIFFSSVFARTKKLNWGLDLAITFPLKAPYKLLYAGGADYNGTLVRGSIGIQKLTPTYGSEFKCHAWYILEW